MRPLDIIRHENGSIGPVSMATEANDSTDAELSSIWDELVYPRPYILIELIIIGLILEIGIHYYQNVFVPYYLTYTNFFYLIVVVAGLWYQKKAIWIAIFFSALYLTVEYLPSGNTLTIDSVFRPLMLCLVALVVGSIADRTIHLQHQLREQLALSQELTRTLETANKKLNLLSSITRHDISNQLMPLNAYIELSEKSVDNPADLKEYFIKEKRITDTIAHQINFTRDYEGLGVNSAVWQDVSALIGNAKAALPLGNTGVDIGCPGLFVFADPLLEKVFYNLIDNSLHYGGDSMTAIRVTAVEKDKNLHLLYEDNGNGISREDKKQLFTKGFGKHTGLGLFLSREILSITGITITETGEPGKGARFEITVPEGKYRFTGLS
jgi:signal transduction histidine kinase